MDPGFEDIFARVPSEIRAPRLRYRSPLASYVMFDQAPPGTPSIVSSGPKSIVIVRTAAFVALLSPGKGESRKNVNRMFGEA